MPNLQRATTRELQPVMDTQDAWRRLPPAKRSIASMRELLVKEITAIMESGVSRNVAIDNLLARIEAGSVDAAVIDAAAKLGRKGQPPKRATLHNWVSAYDDGGLLALASKHKGRARTEYGWELRAMQLYGKGSKPAMESVADWLEDEGFTTATKSRVRRFLKSLPQDQGELSRQRLGPKLFRDTQKGFVHRDTSVLEAGFIYQGDGHTVDAYVAHPNTGNAWRPELTAWMDIASRYIVGWYLSEAESSISTLLALSHAIVSHDHVPAMLHIDNGSGYKSTMMNDESVGYYEQFSIQPMFALPGNSKGKGQIERWFRTVRDQFDKRWDTYCGDDMAQETINRLLRDVKAGKRTLPSLHQYKLMLAEWVERYNNRPHPALGGKTPAEVWATLQRVPVELPAAAVIRPRIIRKVRRSSIQHDNRWYTHPDLIHYNKQSVIVEYDLHNDELISVLADDGRWICDARLVQKADYLPASRIEQAKQKRLAGQQKRLQRKLDEVEARSRNTLEAQTARIETLADFDTPALEQNRGQSLDLNDIDFLSTDYIHEQ